MEETFKIKNYSYNLTDYGILEIYITDLQDRELILATLQDCKDMEDYELDNLAQETIENIGYELV